MSIRFSFGGDEHIFAEVSEETRDQYDADIEAVNANKFLPTIREASFSLADFNKDINGTNAKLMEVLHGR